ncbi:hypothetical protein CRG98_038846 [Punica granatum]|uniref:Uncharacterized protein n=1 Tax=Punica granatum TaxID=22663 RepID=A0A2I0IA18_PUNGR|nr:hypothetical protein CRG98_038846 [Punica granatum]
MTPIVGKTLATPIRGWSKWRPPLLEIGRILKLGILPIPADGAMTRGIILRRPPPRIGVRCLRLGSPMPSPDWGCQRTSWHRLRPN